MWETVDTISPETTHFLEIFFNLVLISIASFPPQKNDKKKGAQFD